MAADSDAITVVQACRWTEISRCSYYYQPTRANPKVNEHLAAQATRALTDLPYDDYRTVDWLLGGSKNAIQRL